MIKYLIFVFPLLVCHVAFAGVTIPERDADGASYSVPKMTHLGWQYQHRSFLVQTCTVNGFTETEYDGTSSGFGVLKFYDNTDTELVQGGSESDVDYQLRLDSNCKRTDLDWTPTFDYQIIGGQMRQQNAPGSSIKMWVVGVPGLPVESGGSKVFINNLDMKYLADAETMVADGRVPKELTYNDPIPGTNTMRFKFVGTGLGMTHSVHISIEIFKP